MILNCVHIVYCLDKSSFFKFSKQQQEKLGLNDNNKNFLCSVSGNRSCTDHLITKPEISIPTFINSNDFCKYLSFYDTHSFTNPIDRAIYQKVIESNLKDIVKCKNMIYQPETECKPKIENNKIVMLPQENTITVMEQPKVVTKFASPLSPERTIIENGQTTILPFNNTITTQQKTITATDTVKVTIVNTKTCQLPPNTLISTVFKHIVVTVSPTSSTSSTVQTANPSSSKPKIVIVKEKNSGDTKIDTKTLQALTLLIKELLHKDNCSDRKCDDEKCKADDCLKEDENRDSISKKNILKEFISELGMFKSSNLLGLDFLKNMSLKKNNVDEIEIAKKSCKKTSSDRKEKTNVISSYNPEKVTITTTITNYSKMNEDNKTISLINKKIQELEKKAENIEKKMKIANEKDHKFQSVKNPGAKPPITTIQGTNKAKKTENDLITELLIFINKDRRTEEDILKLLETIAIIKNTRESGVTYSKLIPSTTITVEKTITITKKSKPTTIVKKIRENSVNTKTNTNIKSAFESKNIQENNELKKDEKSIIDKIKALLNLTKPKEYYDQFEIEKLQSEIERKDREIELLKIQRKKKKLEGVEEENFRELKKKLTKLAEKRQKIINEILNGEFDVTDDTEISQELEENYIKNKTIKKDQQIPIITAIRTIHINDTNLDPSTLNNNSEFKKQIENALYTTKQPTSTKKTIHRKVKKNKSKTKNPKVICNSSSPTICQKQLQLKSAEIKLLDKANNKNIKINIPVKEINEAMEAVNK